MDFAGRRYSKRSTFLYNRYIINALKSKSVANNVYYSCVVYRYGFVSCIYVYFYCWTRCRRNFFAHNILYIIVYFEKKTNVLESRESHCCTAKDYECNLASAIIGAAM